MLVQQLTVPSERFQSKHEQASSRSDPEEELVRTSDVALEVDASVILEMEEMGATWRSASATGWVMEGVGKGGEAQPGRRAAR